MQLNKYLIIGSVFLASCGGLPPKPSINLCQIDYPDGYGICNQTASIVTLQQLNVIVANPRVAASTHLPIAGMDKYECVSQADWKQIQDYINALVQAAQK